MARALQLPAEAIVAMDCGYVDYTFLDSLTEQGVFFVTRLKDNAAFGFAEELSDPRDHILADDLINLPGSGKSHNPQRQMRRVAVWDDTGERQIVLLTSHRKLGAATMAAIYKQRWQIGLFFKALKQNFEIKTFVGTSANAVRIQIWTALIAILLLKFLQLRSRIGWSLSNLIALPRMNLFVHRDLRAWLDMPYDGPPDPPPIIQSTFHLA